jgi:hypothetical protein
MDVILRYFMSTTVLGNGTRNYEQQNDCQRLSEDLFYKMHVFRKLLKVKLLGSEQRAKKWKQILSSKTDTHPMPQQEESIIRYKNIC